ncbi:MAG: 2,3-bisphosphoglycerate-dependent phosphoglycerate mutase [Hydrogenophilaceae bacterium]|nr:2,3-bisphosphoglycerate-dependent phosphoglycerate mutase [Hydrogenophilaceae bacterium]
MTTEATPIVLVRHAQSEWNLAQRFTGWADPGLTEAGRAEARAAGERLAGQGYRFDAATCSLLQRTHETLGELLIAMGHDPLPVQAEWRINERHYGALEGLSKPETMSRYGADQFLRWRRGYLDKPPLLSDDDPRHPRNRAEYTTIGESAWTPGESLADTESRIARWWHEVALPAARSGRRMLVVSHGNTLRALIKYLDRLSPVQVEALEVPTGKPLAYEVRADGSLLGGHRYL